MLILALELIGLLFAAEVLFLGRWEDRGVEWEHEDH